MTILHPRSERFAWLHDPKATCDIPESAKMNPWRIVLLGAPGVGKGTQAQLLSQSLNACHLSTGDVFRAARAAGEDKLTPAMAFAVACMKGGKLVPDETVLDVIRERECCIRCPGGFILDGFPRTVPQAQALEADMRKFAIPLDAVVDFVLPIEQIVARLSGRRTCANCKAVYHVENRPPKVENICDACGKNLIQRDDDRPESIRVRMAAYQESTAPLTAFYQERSLLISIDASGTPEQIAQRATRALHERREKR